MTAVKMRELATRFHDGQFRKGPDKIPYIEHPRAVVDKLTEWGVTDPVTFGIAWGHDLLEDTLVTELDILVTGGRRVLDGIMMLTHRKGEDKDAYFANLAENAPYAILIVKCADRFCNAMDFKRIGRTAYAIEYLGKGRCLFENYGLMKYYDECLRLLKGK